MTAWRYLKTAFWQRVRVPMVGEVPLNAFVLGGFGIAGLDHPGFWTAGAVWEVLWLGCTAGRQNYRRRVDAAARRQAWRTIEERRLQLYNQLSGPDQVRHHTLRQTCQSLLSSRSGTEPDPAAELFTWFHLKLLLARNQADRMPGFDPDVPRLHAGAAVELTDPARARLAEEAVTLLDRRQGLSGDPQLPLLLRIDAALQRVEEELAAAVRQRTGGPVPVAGFVALAQSARGMATEISQVMPPLPATREMDLLIGQVTGPETGAATVAEVN